MFLKVSDREWINTAHVASIWIDDGRVEIYRTDGEAMTYLSGGDAEALCWWLGTGEAGTVDVMARYKAHQMAHEQRAAWLAQAQALREAAVAAAERYVAEQFALEDAMTIRDELLRRRHSNRLSAITWGEQLPADIDEPEAEVWGNAFYARISAHLIAPQAEPVHP